MTGASAGVGRALVREFAKRGCHVAILARGQEGLDGARREVEEAGGPWPVRRELVRAPEPRTRIPR